MLTEQFVVIQNNEVVYRTTVGEDAVQFTILLRQSTSDVEVRHVLIDLLHNTMCQETLVV